MELLHRNDYSERELWSATTKSNTKNQNRWGREKPPLHSTGFVFLKILLTPPTSS
jgi:hypothetical protein